MDFPANVTTNLNIVVSPLESGHLQALKYDQEDLEKIYWSLWAYTDLQLSNHVEDRQDEHLAAIAVVYHLRENNSYVFWDTAQQQLWLFVPLVSGRTDQRTDAFNQTLALRGFSELSHGALRASALQSAERVVSNFEDGSSQVLSSTTCEHVPPSGWTMPQVADIYEKAMSSIRSTFSHHLAKIGNWILLGNSTCINLVGLDEEPFEQSRHESSGRKTDVIEFISRWDATGRLSVLSSLSQSEALYTVASYTLFTSQALGLGAPALVSPSGIRVTYRGILNIADERTTLQIFNSMKIRCSTYLAQQGLSVSPKANWALVEIPQTPFPHQNPNSQPAQPLLTIWPAKYVLCKEEMDAERIRSLDISGLSQTLDPMARAESWYLGRAVRAKEVEIARKDTELKAQRQQPSQDESDVGVPSEIASPPFRDIVPQDVSGIYPTPPDGLLSHLSETPASNAQQEASPNFTTIDQTIPSPNNPEYHDARDEDFFGDMDMDMVGEADFNFFDEPGNGSEASNNMMQGVHPRKDIVEERIGNISPKLSSDSILVNKSVYQESPPMKSMPDDKVDPSAADAKTDDAIRIVEGWKTFHETEILEVDHVQSNSTRPISTEGNGAPEEPPPYQFLQDFPKSGGKIHLGRGSFNSMSPVTLDIDRKYGDSGRFGYQLGKIRNFDLALLRKEDEYHEIPQIGLKESSTSSPDSEEEERDEGGEEEADDETIDSRPPNILGHDISEDLRQMSESISHSLKWAKMGSKSRPATPKSPESVSGKFGRGLVTDSIIDPSFPPSTFFNPVTRQVLTDRTFWECGPRKPLYTSDEHSFIQVAQILADQIARENPSSSVLIERPIESSGRSRVRFSHHEALASIVSGVFPSIKTRSLLDLIDLSGDESGTSQNVFKLDGSPVGVQRMGNMTDILPSATPFWEGLSLCPFSGPKDVNAFCVFPKIDYLMQPSKMFLEMIKGAYQTCNLGRHTLDGPQSAFPHSLVPVSTLTIDTNVSFAKLGRHLAGLRLCDGNFVIYMVNISEDNRAIPGLCNAFLNLFWSYRLALGDEDLKNPNDLVLQIVPSSMVFSRDQLVLPSPAEYKRLALQVYDRCGPNSANGQDPKLPFVCAPAIRLSKPVPKTIDFKLAPNPSSALLDPTDDCLHLAYKWETGQQWLTASWTNNLGTLQWNAAYWLSRDDDIQKSFLQATVKMLDITTEMFQPRGTPRRIYVASDGLFEAHEIATWDRLRVDKALSLDITLLKISSSPSLEVFLPSISIVISELPDFLATPASTPYANGQSPEVSTHTTTFGSAGAQGALPAISVQNDADARLIDITNETWGTIVDSATINISVDSERTKAKPQGYLIKRAGTEDQDGLLLVQVDIVHGSEPQQPLLKELLSMYRDLASLARVRNIVDPVTGVLPIHVAAAAKAHAALCKSMRYTE